MIVTWEGRTFEIDGVPYGRGPVWALVKEKDEPMTAEQFYALPPEGRDWLADAVQLHIDRLNDQAAEP